MTRTAPELCKLQHTPAGGCLTTTCDLACSRPNTRSIFSGIGFWTRNPPVSLPVDSCGFANLTNQTNHSSRTTVHVLSNFKIPEHWLLSITTSRV
ncbi:hypothetical protein AVEN_206948-1 [Araneus ventricosus]|uniref:Uncharacterized protein n=1 Tax=Araneus ventricosus TaxID=182803 RepID=A0A4Y2E1X3_ARAVE|nr:hypothetical protein AVEN_206948-1 [Araneus ventricosus]